MEIIYKNNNEMTLNTTAITSGLKIKLELLDKRSESAN